MLEDIRTWLIAAPRSVTSTIRINVQPDLPDTVVTLTDTGGYGLETEGALDNPTFQVRCRGPSQVVARDTAFLIDGFLLDQGEPFSVGDTWVLVISRSGGRPSYLITDEGGRTTYTCNYIAKSER